MNDETLLDRYHTAMEDAPEDDGARLQFYERLADCELFVLLDRVAEDDQISPEVFPVDGSDYVLVFDREDRLADFVGAAAPYAALSGRMVVQALAGQGAGLGLNLGVAPSSILIPPEAVDWLAQTLNNAPEEVEDRFDEVRQPAGFPEALLGALNLKLASAAGLAPYALLVRTTGAAGDGPFLLAFVDAQPGAEGALAKAVGEAVTFADNPDVALDVTFLASGTPVADRMARVGLRLDLPEPPKPEIAAPSAPGMDPDKPPRLK